MRAERWMAVDERTEEEKKRDLLSYLRSLEAELERQLKEVRARISRTL